MGESYLKNLIQADGAVNFCSYCENENPTLSVEEVADLIERAFDDHYAMYCDSDSDYECDLDGEPAMQAILNAADVSVEIATDIQLLLEDRYYDHESAQMGEHCPFSSEAHYAEKDAGHGEFLMLWHDFEIGLKTQSRFFSRSAKSTLDEIFAGVAGLQTTQGAPVVVAAGPETSVTTLYRARVFAGEDDKLKQALMVPWAHLGTPPADAASAGRMNARGIAVFYGARDAETALSEVRPPVGSKVGLARFDILRPLRILDLSALKSVAAGGSIFDPATIGRMQRGNFLEKLSHLMSRAVMPHDESSEYLPTQAIADYLANEVRLDGIIFPSVQTGQESSNVVLFHHAARVEEVDLPNGTSVDAYLETTDSDGNHPDYWVSENVPPPELNEESRTPRSPLTDDMFEVIDDNSDPRSSSLRIDCETIQIHHVRAVSFTADVHSVRRHRIER